MASLRLLRRGLYLWRPLEKGYSGACRSAASARLAPRPRAGASVVTVEADAQYSAHRIPSFADAEVKNETQQSLDLYTVIPSPEELETIDLSLCHKRLDALYRQLRVPERKADDLLNKTFVYSEQFQDAVSAIDCRLGRLDGEEAVFLLQRLVRFVSVAPRRWHKKIQGVAYDVYKRVRAGSMQVPPSCFPQFLITLLHANVRHHGIQGYVSSCVPNMVPSMDLKQLCTTLKALNGFNITDASCTDLLLNHVEKHLDDSLSASNALKLLKIMGRACFQRRNQIIDYSVNTIQAKAASLDSHDLADVYRTVVALRLERLSGSLASLVPYLRQDLKSLSVPTAIHLIETICHETKPNVPFALDLLNEFAADSPGFRRIRPSITTLYDWQALYVAYAFCQFKPSAHEPLRRYAQQGLSTVPRTPNDAVMLKEVSRVCKLPLSSTTESQVTDIFSHFLKSYESLIAEVQQCIRQLPGYCDLSFQPKAEACTFSVPLVAEAQKVVILFVDPYYPFLHSLLSRTLKAAGYTLVVLDKTRFPRARGSDNPQPEPQSLRYVEEVLKKSL